MEVLKVIIALVITGSFFLFVDWMSKQDPSAISKIFEKVVETIMPLLAFLLVLSGVLWLVNIVL